VVTVRPLVVAIAATLALTFWSANMFGWGKWKSSLTGEWAAAESVALPYVKKHWSYKPEKVEPVARWPYLLQLDTNRRVLVHHGAVIEIGAGLSSLSSYFKDIKALERSLDVEALLDILDYFGAFPADIDASAYLRAPRAPESLRPRLERDDHGLRLVLSFEHVPKLPPGVGGPRNRDLLELERWTLTVPPDYRLAWTKETTTVKRPPELY
jgi:hypothetical protein